MTPPVAPHRAVCDRCRRPAAVCYCAHLVTLETRTRVLLLQHPRERRMPVGTARLAHLCLPGSELRVGVDFDDDLSVQRALAEAAASGHPAHLLFPGPRAVDLAQAKPSGPITLVVIDGTWWQARKLLKRNARLRELPQLRFTPPAPSRYRIRREPSDDYVATVEALAHVLGALEGEPDRFAGLLRPFEAMVDMQLQYAKTVSGARRRHAANRARAASRPKGPPLLRERAADVICVHGETNAWPARRPGGHPSEVVHWVAWRAATGETFESVIAPRRPLAPSIPSHIRIAGERLFQGESWASFQARWAGFARETDVVCSWGRYPLDILASEGGWLPAARFDVRPAVGPYFGMRAGAVEDCAARLDLVTAAPFAIGRGGTRLAALSAIVGKLMSLA